MPRIIKKYGNRKLYDSSESRYISMTELKEIIRSGETVVINDSKTGYEITSEVLTKAIVDQGGKETLSPDALHALIRWGTETFESGLAIFGKSLHKVLPVANVSDVRSLLGKISELEERVDSLQQKVDEQQNRSELS
ncbi:MAG: polyhydroxyalkanoate synthesis regulator DNA-binding domain-containing protein [Balneolia bacterium]|nr:polyhydroxyalkanoate synthesis regulator DNA-binding domain-containing protein [Balneolia bacterium]